MGGGGVVRTFRPNHSAYGRIYLQLEQCKMYLLNYTYFSYTVLIWLCIVIRISVNAMRKRGKIIQQWNASKTYTCIHAPMQLVNYTANYNLISVFEAAIRVYKRVKGVK